ncbi:ankyrin repeat-containing protein [Colletotrichum tofieldiae]|nr:ankyrin repeat-containing protein [Colletotrichum tofieldiae]
MADDAYFGKLLQWLSPLSFTQKQEEILSSADPNTWVLGSEEFKRWHEGNVRSLWCYGPPGAGKSVVAASIFTHLVTRHETENSAVLVAFCSFDSEESKSPRSVVANLLKQVLQIRADGKVPSKLKELYNQATLSKDGKPLGLDSLEKVLGEELDLFDSAFIILDGLDETGNESEREKMVDALHNYGPRIKVIITSRHSEDIQKALDKTQVCCDCKNGDSEAFWRCTKRPKHVICDSCHAIALSRDGTQHPTVKELRWEGLWYQPRSEDIRSYISRRIETNTDFQSLLEESQSDESLERTLVTTVTEKSENIFLLARLHMDLLTDCWTMDQVEENLNSLSGDLDEIYSKTLTRMQRSLRPNQWQVLRKLLLWIAWAQRPLSISEMEHALAVRPSLNDITKGSILPIRKITTWSAGLLFIDSDDLIRYIHPTTSRYFLQQREATFPNGDGIIAHACLDYLNMTSLRETVSGPNKHSLFWLRLKNYPFLEYSVLQSSQHISRSTSKDDDYRALTFLCSDSRNFFLQALYYLDEEWSVERNATAMHVAAYMGLTHVISELVMAGEAVDARDAFGATPLMYAAAKGDDGVKDVNCLLAAGADPALSCQMGSTALIRAVNVRSAAVVARLVREPDISINAVPSDPNGTSEPAIVAAFYADDRDIFDVLLTREDIDVNVRSTRGYSTLQLATLEGSIWATRAILSHKDIDIDLEDPDDAWTPLFSAVSAGFTEGVELLLGHGANLHHLDKNSGTVLMRAADYDRENLVGLLLKRGLDPHVPDFLGRTVLHSAAVNMAWDSLKLILESVPDIDVNVQGKGGETPLHDVCRQDDSTGVMILVAAGARCDIRDEEGRTPMDIATNNRRILSLEILKTAKGYENVTGSRPTKSLTEAINTDPANVLQRRIKKTSVGELNFAKAFSGTPLCQACWRDRSDVAEMLLKAGADPNLTNAFNRAPLFLAIEAGSLSCLQVLISHKADINQTPYLPLWEYAMARRQKDMALILLEHGADISNGSGYLQLALHFAVRKKSIVATKRLLEAGASMQLKTGGIRQNNWPKALMLNSWLN